MVRDSKELDDLFSFAITEFGIGGYVSTSQILEHYNPLTAEIFAEIACATDAMPGIFGNSIEATKASNIELVIQRNEFAKKPYFQLLVELFVDKFGTGQNPGIARPPDRAGDMSKLGASHVRKMIWQP